MSEKEFTMDEIKGHDTRKDLYMVIHDKVYDCASFLDEHPGGEEVMVDSGGQDATEAFEDVGHSDEACEVLEGLLIGSLKKEAGETKPTATYPTTTGAAPVTKQPAALGAGLYALILVGGGLAYMAYQYLTASSEKA